MLRTWLVLTLLLCIAAVLPRAFAQEPVHRCTTLEGDTIYTDKKCEDLGAMDRLPDVSADGHAGSSSLYRGTCSRTLSDLVYQITAAVDAHDVNRLAGVYDWSGVSDAGANRVLDQLEAVVNRPLVDIAPVRPAQPITDAAGNVVDSNADGYYPQSNSQRPIGLRLEQTLKNSATPSRTVFGLRRSFKCFWITL